MPNGGPTPSCLYCKHFLLDDRKCSFHDFTLGVAIPRIFCINLSIENETEWVEAQVDLNALLPQKLYLWIEVTHQNSDGSVSSIFNLHPFLSLEASKELSEEAEGELVAQLHDQQRAAYRKQGYKVVS